MVLLVLVNVPEGSLLSQDVPEGSLLSVDVPEGSLLSLASCHARLPPSLLPFPLPLPRLQPPLMAQLGKHCCHAMPVQERIRTDLQNYTHFSKTIQAFTGQARTVVETIRDCASSCLPLQHHHYAPQGCLPPPPPPLVAIACHLSHLTCLKQL